eukprot:TRINITY_DN2889_c0_g1_i1.p1 TRINITY_DN2889_c0_g1~~TRINITY_DN2889_c0_g1_i1.p1  ORF type:complete len:100 (-),score=44.75 TRINITY_DN2889_c0_g1_i1:107-406(-)
MCIRDRGGPLLVTDWAYELVDTIWPDAMTFIENDPARQGTQWVNLDAAQLGVIDNITADIVDDDLAAVLGSDTMAVDFPYSALIPVSYTHLTLPTIYSV